ncbi:MAG TPA: ATP-binding protein [Bacillus sp. (in: firmicutes)]|nr:ATP-binding protein [Bacillus sp. (in: firmicutes)]
MSKFLFQELFNVSIIPMLVMKQSGEILFVNDALLTLHGLERASIIGGNFNDVYHLLSVKKEELAEMMANDEKFDLFKTNVHQQFLHIYTQRLELEEYEEPLFVLQWKEFSHNIQKQEEIIRKMKQYKQFIKQSQDAFIVTVNGVIQYMNPAGVHLLGGTKKEEYIGKPFCDFIHPNHLSLVQERMNRLMLGLPIEPRAEVNLVTNRGIVSIESSATRVRFKGQAAIQYFIRDVTDRKHYDEMVNQSEKLTIVSKLAAGVAHEIRNPMTAIKGFIQLLKASKQYNEEYSDIMLEELNRVESIIHEFLTLAKPKKESNYSKKNLQQILNHVTLLLTTHASYKDCQINTFLPEDPLEIRCEENGLKQVLINIIQNGLESMRKGTLTVILEKLEHEAKITIQDEGCGIKEEDLARLGEPFYSTKPSGTGLGLMISYRIIEQHNGRMSFSSKVGEGTRVEVLLPLIKENVQV